MSEFDFNALYEALEAQRRERGLSWAQVHVEMDGVATSTITGMRSKGSVEGDGVLRMLCWLGRTPESFVPDIAGADMSEWKLPELEPGQKLRFDTQKLHTAIDAERTRRGITWQDVAGEIGGFSPAMLKRLALEGRVGFPRVMRIVRWLGRPTVDFTRVTDW